MKTTCDWCETEAECRLVHGDPSIPGTWNSVERHICEDCLDEQIQMRLDNGSFSLEDIDMVEPNKDPRR